MKKNCDRFVEKILSSDMQYSDEVVAHIRECSECRSLASEWRSVRNINRELEDTPSALDSRISFAAASRDRFSGFRNVIHKCIYVTAAAACVMLITSMFLFGDKRPDSASAMMKSDMPWDPMRLDFRIIENNVELDLGAEMLNIEDQKDSDVDNLLFPEIDRRELPIVPADQLI